MRAQKFIILLFSLLIAALQSYSQDYKLKFEQIGINDGLSQSTVRCIFQDSKGFMWFGTKDGLNKYDGYKFTVYRRDPLNANSLGSNDIKSIVDDKKGNLWIATWDGGLNYFDPGSGVFTRFLKKDHRSNSISSNFLESLCRDDNDNIWIGTADNGLDRYNIRTRQFTNYKFSKADFGSISGNNISAIFQDSHKNIWVGTTSGLNLFDEKTNTFRRFNYDVKNPLSLSDDHVKFIYEDKSHTIWVGTYGGGLNKLDVVSGDFKVYKKENSKLSSDMLISIAGDLKGNLWIGTENGGLNIFDPVRESFQLYNNEYNNPGGLTGSTINAVVADSKGNMWLGTLNGGVDLSKRDKENFGQYEHEQNGNSLVNNIVNCIYEDSKLNLWIGTDGGGVDLFDRRTKHFQNFKNDKANVNSISGNYILSVCEDPDGNIWIGSWGKGISIYNPATKRFRFLKKSADPGSLSSDYAFYIFKDSRNRMWVGTYGGGLDRYDALKNKFVHYAHNDKIAESISSNNILTLNEDRDHHILVGTDGAGLSVLDPQTGKCSVYKDLESKNGLSNNSISSIYRDQQDHLWLSTNDGLDELDEHTGTVRSFFMENGLPSNLIAGVLEDHKGNLWIATDNGLSRFNLKTKAIKNYNRADGLQANEFKNSRCYSKTGQMYFGGINGFNEFYPDSIADLKFDPPIVFTDLEVFDKHVTISSDKNPGSPIAMYLPYDNKVELSYQQSVVTFEFASLNYVNREKKQYAYILEGFDNQWHFLGTKNNVTYTNLDPGYYTLKVKGFNNTGDFSTKTAEVKIVVYPPFWKTWWFEGLMLLLLVGVIITIFYLRVRSIKIRNKILEAKVTRRTQELKEANLVLTKNNDRIRIQNEKLEIYNKEIIDKSDKILDQQEHIISQNAALENTVNELEKSNKTKERFLSILAHDLRNPVTAIAGIAKNVKDQIPQLTKTEIGRYINILSDSSKSVLELLLNLLDWAKTQNKTLIIDPEPVNICDVLKKSQVLMDQLLRNKNIYLTINVNEHHAILADKKMVDTVFRNLLSNSIKFTPPFGQISIGSKELEDAIEIIFYDTGLGMTGAQLNNLFNIENSTSSLGSNGETGSGLGMVIIKEFVEANHGSIMVNSIANEGSTFTIRLPKYEAADNLPVFQQELTNQTTIYQDVYGDPVADQRKMKLQGKRLLFIDDNSDIRAYLRLVLSPTFELMEAENGAEGIKAAIDFQPDIIITDMLMPVMNGLELCKKLKLNPLTSHIPVILLTSQTDTLSQLSGYEAGADTYLIKPLNPQILHQVIYNLVMNTINLREKFASSEEIYPNDFIYNSRDKEFLDKIIVYIEQNIGQQNLDHKKICEVAAMSRTILYAKVKSLTGQGVHEFIQSTRVKKGLQLLMEGRLNINQISYEVGFNTPSYFSKCFLKQFGASPKDYVLKMHSHSKKQGY